MSEQFQRYITGQFQFIPTELFEGFLSIFCLFTIGSFTILGIKKGVRLTSALLLIEYAFIIVSSTFIFRAANEENSYNFSPAWSYYAILDGNEIAIIENVMNVVAFIPVGFLLCCAFMRMKWWEAVFIGCFFSISIEASQFYFQRVFAETDDVIHNTIGCALGYSVYKFLQASWRKIHNSKSGSKTC